MLKYIWREHKKIILFITIFVVCSIAIALGIYAQITNAKIAESKADKEEKNYTELKNNFKSLFSNSVIKASSSKTDLSDDDLIYLAYDINEKEGGKYDLNIKLPLFAIETSKTEKINNEIMNIFAQKIIDIIKKNKTNTIYSLDYCAFVNDNILSLAVRATLKEGSSAQRIIIQTYNYDLENDKLLSIYDIINYKGLKEKDVQNKINSEIKTISEQKSNIENQGYNVYKRDPSSSIYELGNTEVFFLDNNSNLYIVYPYGNNNNTSEMDLIIF